jgi:hypothetical protein
VNRTQRKNLNMLQLRTVHVERCDGGPEEGGWCYDAGVVTAFGPTFFNRSNAERARNEAQDYLDATENAGRRPIYSVLSDGWERAMLAHPSEPDYFPSHTPHYE